MATAIASEVAPDVVLSFDLRPGKLLQFLESRAEKGPRLKCFEGSVTLVSPGMPHEVDLDRLTSLVLAVCMELRIKISSLRSTTWYLPLGVGDTAYEADAAYYIQSFGRAKEHQPPDLAIEVVVTNPATKALRAGAFLKISELWVFDIPRRSLTFYHLESKGKKAGVYRPDPRSLAFPYLASAEVLERLDDLEADTIAFIENCRGWAREVLVPRFQVDDGGA